MWHSLLVWLDGQPVEWWLIGATLVLLVSHWIERRTGCVTPS